MIQTNEQIFRHSFTKLVWIYLGLLLFGILVFLTGLKDYISIMGVVILLIIALFYSTSSVKISDEEIVTHGLLGSKSLKWSEINRASVRGQSLRLHNYDGDITLSIDSQLEGYIDILNIIFKKLPNLLDAGENNFLSKSILTNIISVALSLLLVSIAILFLVYQGSDWFISILFVGLGIYILISWLLSPQGVALEGSSLSVVYLFKKVSHRADEISAIALEKRRTRNGYFYFVRLNLKTGKPVKLSMQGAILAYETLKRWHEKTISGKPSFLDSLN